MNPLKLTASFLAVAVLAVGSPAVAQPAPVPTAGAAGDVSPLQVGATDMAAMRARYSSLAGALADYHADRAGTDLPALLASGSSAFGVTLTSPAHDLEGLNSQLRLSNPTFATDSFTSFSQFRTQLATDRSLDSAVALGAARFSLGGAALHAPELRTPHIDASAFALSAPSESLVFGQLYKDTWTTFVADHPDAFAQVATSDVMDPAARAAFDSSLSKAAAKTTSDFSQFLPSPCHAGLVQAAATGEQNTARKVTGGDPACNPCVTAGVYLNADWKRTIDLRWNSPHAPDAGSDGLTAGSWNQLDDRVRASNQAANPNDDGGSRHRPQPPASVVNDCAASGQATKAATEAFVPDVVDVLDQMFR